MGNNKSSGTGLDHYTCAIAELPQPFPGALIAKPIRSNNRTIRQMREAYELNVSIMNDHIANNTLTSDILADLIADTGIKILDNLPIVEGGGHSIYLTQDMQDKYLSMRLSFRYVQEELITDVFVIETCINYVTRRSKIDTYTEVYMFVLRNIVKNAKYFPDRVYTDKFLNYIFDAANKIKYYTLKNVSGVDYVKKKDNVELLVLNFKKGIIKMIPDSVMNKMLVKCIIAEDSHLRSTIKPELLVLYDQ
jgi:hypothetical protein